GSRALWYAAETADVPRRGSTGPGLWGRPGGPTMAGIRGLAEIVIWVQDMDTSLAFYRDRLGLTVISPPHLPATFLRIGAEGAGVPQQIVLVPRPAGSAVRGRTAD